MPGGRCRGRLLRRARRLSIAQATRAGGWLVLAPHPDDETLGVGGLVATLAAAGHPPTVAFLTDGSGSHAGAPGWSARRISALRAREAGAALRALGSIDAPLFLGWRDAAPFAQGSADFRRTVRRLAVLCRRQGIRRIATTWEGEPHCDHEAAARVARAVAAELGTRPLFFCVWGWTLPDLDDRLRAHRIHAIPVARWRGDVRRALACHRSQFGGRIWSAPERFVLPRQMQRLVDAPILLLMEKRRAP